MRFRVGDTCIGSRVLSEGACIGGEMRRPWFHVEPHLLPAGAELDDIARKNLGRRGNSRAIDEGAIAATHITDGERQRIRLYDTENGMTPANELVFVGIEGDGCVRVPAERELLRTVQRELLDLINLRAAQMRDDDVPHDRPLCGFAAARHSLHV
jgi:hypothetical protein